MKLPPESFGNYALGYEWDFLNWSRRRAEAQGSFYDFIMLGIIKPRTEIVRWDHPEKRLVEKLMRNDEVRSKK